jgi:1,4-dihydroxy-2-naphthoate octaprenyltransferase
MEMCCIHACMIIYTAWSRDIPRDITKTLYPGYSTLGECQTTMAYILLLHLSYIIVHLHLGTGDQLLCVWYCTEHTTKLQVCTGFYCRSTQMSRSKYRTKQVDQTEVIISEVITLSCDLQPSFSTSNSARSRHVAEDDNWGQHSVSIIK